MRIFALLVLLLLATPISAAPSVAEKFAVTNVVTAVSVSPDGKFLALIRSQPRSGETVLEVYDSDELGKQPFRLSHAPMRLLDLAWVSDDTLLLGLLQQGDNPPDTQLSVAMSVVDVKRKSVTLIPEANPLLTGYWPTSGYRVVLSVPQSVSDVDDASIGPMPSPIWFTGKHTFLHMDYGRDSCRAINMT